MLGATEVVAENKVDRLSPREPLLERFSPKGGCSCSKVDEMLIILSPVSLEIPSMTSERRVEVVPEFVRLSAKRTLFVLKTSGKTWTPASFCSLMVQKGVALNFSSKSGCWAPSEAPAKQIVVEKKVKIVAQKIIRRQRALAPLGADVEVMIFILAVCFSDGGHTQTNFHER